MLFGKLLRSVKTVMPVVVKALMVSKYELRYDVLRAITNGRAPTADNTIQPKAHTSIACKVLGVPGRKNLLNINARINERMLGIKKA